VRYGLTVGKPVAVTPLPIFDDVTPAVFQLPGISPSEIAQGIQAIIGAVTEGSENARTKEHDAAHWREAHRYIHLGLRLNGIVNALNQVCRIDCCNQAT
jgi:O-antigen biosynthesis alpha-1,2-mannosyltransferase